MVNFVWRILCVAAVAGSPSVAGAGWIVEWETTPIRKDQRQDTQVSTSYMEDGKARIEQEHITTIYDYGDRRFTVLNPKSKFFWSGSVDDFVKRTVKRRNEALQKRFGVDADDEKGDELPEIDPESLPEITIERTDERAEIAGYETYKYVVRVNEELFQEIWVAEDLDLSDEIDPGEMIEYQKKSSRGMIGKSSAPYNALYRSDAYRDFLRKGYGLKTLTHHIAGSFEQVARSVQRADIDDARFTPPQDYRRVRLDDVFEVEEQR